MIKFNNDWDCLLSAEFNKPYYLNLRKFLINEYKDYLIFPAMDYIFTALKLTACKDTKVVIIGQDPYHNPNQAHGLAFSVIKDTPLPPSLQNIYQEIENEFGFTMSSCGDLTKWAKQGVLLLNNVLTVRMNIANSHKNQGWEIFTDRIISLLNEQSTPLIFLLWGKQQISKEVLITNPHHYILKAPHPSPLSAYRGFFGCNHFIKTNQILKNLGKEEIDWQN